MNSETEIVSHFELLDYHHKLLVIFERDRKGTGLETVKKSGLFHLSHHGVSIRKYVIKDIHNSWLYCFTNPLELGTRVSPSHRQPNVLVGRRRFTVLNSYYAKAKHVSQVQED